MTPRSGSGCELVRVRSRLRRVVAVVALVFSAACSGSGGDEEAATTTTFQPLFDPPAPTVPAREISEGQAACGLLSRADVEAALGAAVSPGRGTEREGAGSSCTWSLRSEPTQGVSIASGPGDESSFEARLRGLGGSGQDVVRFRDGVVAPDGTAVGLRGGVLVLLVVNIDEPDATEQEISETLIRSALNRI